MIIKDILFSSVSNWGFGSNLDTTIRNWHVTMGVHTSTADWVDNGPDCDVTTNGAIAPLTRTGSAGLSRGKIERLAVVELRWGKIGDLGGQSRHDVEAVGVHIEFLWVICRPFEGSTAKTTTLDLVIPCLLVDRLEVIVHY